MLGTIKGKTMFNIYVGKEVEGFHSSADMGYVCDFLMEIVNDNRYINDLPHHYHHQSNEFEKDMLQFIFGKGQ